MKKWMKTSIAMLMAAAMIASGCYTVSAEETLFDEEMQTEEAVADLFDPSNAEQEQLDLDEEAEEETQETAKDPEPAANEDPDPAENAEEERFSENEPGIKNNDSEELSDIRPAGASKGEAITGSFDAVDGMDITTIRYCWTEKSTDEAGNETENQLYGFADFAQNEEGKYVYTFTAPCDGFESVQASETVHGGEDISGANVIAAYYDLNTWDGAVDVSWYDGSASEFHLYTPAQFAGFAAIVNGSIDSDIQNYNVKGSRSYSEFMETAKDQEAEREDQTIVTGKERGLPDCIECEYYKNTDLGGPVSGPCFVGLEKNDFLNKTVYLEADLQMGGGDGTVLDQEEIYEAKTNLHDGTNEGYAYYPNWMPVGGLFLSDVDDLNTAVKAAFNGVLDGCGHYLYNLYCYRWSYPKPNTTAYGYADSTGVIGRLAYLYSKEEGKQEIIPPAIRNLGLTGFVIGRRSVGGILGRAGGSSTGSTATGADEVGSGVYYSGAIYLENLVNHATVYATDSKGVAGIVGTFWNKDVMDGETLKTRRGGSIINCYNRGNIRQLEYSGPASGIVGENDSADIFCCYSTGEVPSTSKMGRGIGSNDAGRNYTVAACYYLKDHYDCDVPDYYGYYYQNAASSVSITTEMMTEGQMTDGTLLSALNVNGTAYYQGADGYPVLSWEAGAEGGMLTYGQSEGGVVTGSLPEGFYPAGTIVYLSATEEEGWQCRYYTANDVRIEGSYATISKDMVLSAFYQKSGKGYIEIPNNPICTVSVYRVTGTEETGYEYTELKNGDPIAEGDDLAVEAVIKDGQAPEDPNMEYRADAGVEQPFMYMITYQGVSSGYTYVKSLTVSEAINEGDAALTIEVQPLTIQKLWKNFSDISWYDKETTAFTITTPEELAGVDRLVETEATDFYGVTLTLGGDISLENTDGSGGIRSWDGIGNASAKFAGTFDGAGHSITDIAGVQYGLFARVEGKSTKDRAVIRNVSIFGSMTGYSACGIAARTAYTQIENCSNYCMIDGSEASGSTYSGGIVGFETTGCVITDCINYAPVRGSYRTGGIIGESSGTSENAGTMTNCINYGEITVPEERPTLTYAGGIAGTYKGSMTGCANYGDVLSKANYSGGLVGFMTQSGNTITAKMTDCFNAGDLYAFVRTTGSGSTLSQCGMGGLIGNASRFVLKNCFNYGSVESEEGYEGYLGNFAGRYTANDNNKTENVYLLDTACRIILTGSFKDGNTTKIKSLTIEEVEALDKTDVKGIKTADAAAFASGSGVLASINGNRRFALTNGTYPELTAEEAPHIHHGGTATCSHKAVCEECGLPYGRFDPDNHEKTETRNAVAPEWTQEGFSGDVYCTGCGELLQEGEPVFPDTSVKILKVSVTTNGHVLWEQDYSIDSFDSLASTELAGYQYGKEGGVTETCMASNRYVTLEALLNDMGWSMNSLISATVTTASSFETCTKETLLTRNLYVDKDRSQKTVPAAIGISYVREKGFAEDIIKDAVYGPLVFMTGLSEEDIKAGSVGGFRLIMPVESVSFEVDQAEEPIRVESVNLDKSRAEIAASKTMKLTADAAPKYANRTIKWSSSDPSVADVDQNGLVTAKKYGIAVITAASADGPSASCEIQVLLKDVANHGKSYFDPVYWAVGKGITKVSVEFRPDDPVNRGEFTAFLYRLADSPKVTKITNKFSDVTKDTKFAKEISWAVSAGVINGYKDGTFRPTENITRAQVAIMIWRYAGKQIVKVRKSPFPDVELNGSDTSNAIIWGNKNGIMKGSGGRFLPKDTCTRGQTVTFLYRYYEKFGK